MRAAFGILHAAIQVVLYGLRVIALMEGAQGEVGRRQPHVTVHELVVFAALLVTDAGSVLLTYVESLPHNLSP